METRKHPLPLAVMLLLNFIPLVGVIWWGWTMFYVIYLFWFESLLLAVFTALRILFAKQNQSSYLADMPAFTGSRMGLAVRYLLIRIAVLMFYLLFIVVFVGFVTAPKDDYVDVLKTMMFMNQTFNTVILAFICSQLLDFGYNYIMNGENERTAPQDLNVFFDTRTIIMHIVIVLGAVLSTFTEKKMAGHTNYSVYIYAVIFIIVKSVTDIVTYKGKGSLLAKLKAGTINKTAQE